MGIPLHICICCETNLHSSIVFKKIWVETSQRVEAKMKATLNNKDEKCSTPNIPINTDSADAENDSTNDQKYKVFLVPENNIQNAQSSKEMATHAYDNVDIHLHRDTTDINDMNTILNTIDENVILETKIKIFEEPLEENFTNCNIFNEIADIKAKEEYIPNLNLNSSSNNKICTDFATSENQNAKNNFQCLICKKKFPRKSNLRNHMICHTATKDHKCPECNKSFSRKCHLKSHMKLHTGQRDFKCPICNKDFIRKFHLICHIQTHTGKRDYKCPSCSKEFIQKHNMTRHIRKHHKEILGLQ